MNDPYFPQIAVSPVSGIDLSESIFDSEDSKFVQPIDFRILI